MTPVGTTIEQAVLEAVRHPRWRGAWVENWRILQAIRVPLTPAATRRALEHLEAEGQVEHRRLGDHVEWRATPR